MHDIYRATIEHIKHWAVQEDNVTCCIAIGSQVRQDCPGDAWSDLDLMLLARDPAALLDGDGWLDAFGRPLCAFNEITVLHFVEWNWCVKRVLYDDGRALDWSIVPAARMDDVLRINQEILARGYEIVYDATAGQAAAGIAALLAPSADEAAPWAPTARALRDTVGKLLFRVIWALKKVQRGELWVAVQEINGPIQDLLLALVEAYNAATAPPPAMLAYEGRFLEQRTDRALLDKLDGCLSGYAKSDAVDALGRLIDLAEWLAQQIGKRNGFEPDPARFKAIRRLYHTMRAG